MSRLLALVAGAFLFLLIGTAPAQAAAQLAVADILLLEDDEELRIVPQDEFIKVRIVLNNTGDAPTNGTITVQLQITSTFGSYNRSETLRRADVVEPGNETFIDYNWSPAGRILGNHSVKVTIGDDETVYNKFFTVAETGVAAGTITERILAHYWFFGLFVVATILFIVVLAARRG